jgi:hypothetical protein
VAAPEDFQPENGQRARDLEVTMRWAVDADRETSRPGSQPVMSSDISINPSDDVPTVLFPKSPWQADPIGWFCSAYGPFRRLVGGSAEAQRLMSTPRPVARLASLFYEDAALTEGVQWLIDKHLRVIKQFHDCYGDLYFEVRGGVPMITAPGVVIVDEVDAHLHVSWQRRIGTWLKTHFPNIQFIVTTHSPYICQAADPGGLIRLPGPSEDEPPQVVDQDLYDRVVYGSGDDAVLSELFGLETPYSQRAEELRRELVPLEVNVLAGEASEADVERYRKLRRLLNSSPSARSDEVSARLRADPRLDG